MIGLLILSMILFLPGCATLFSEKEDVIHIESEPSGATVYINGQKRGKTPFTQSLERVVFDNMQVTLRKKGFTTKKFLLQRNLDTIAILNFLWLPFSFGSSSWGTDALSGAMIRYSPTDYIIELESKDGANHTGESKLKFTITNFNSILVDLANGSGKFLSIIMELYCHHGSHTCGMKLQENRLGLLASNNGVELYRKLEELFRA